MLLTLEKLLENKQNQANGFVAIVDWTNFTLRQSAHLNPKILKLMIEGLQVCEFVIDCRHKLQLTLRLFAGFFSGSLQRCTLHRPTLVCRSSAVSYQAILELENTISNQVTWVQFINTARDDSPRYSSARTWRRRRTIQSVDLVSRSSRIKPNEWSFASLLHHAKYSVFKVTLDCVKGEQQ